MILKISRFHFFEDNDKEETPTPIATPNKPDLDIYAGIIFDIDIDQTESKKPVLVQTLSKRSKCKEYVAATCQNINTILAPAKERLHEINTVIATTKSEEHIYNQDLDQYFLTESGEQFKNIDLNRIYSIIANVNNLKALSSFNTQSFNMLHKTSFSSKIFEALNNFLYFDETVNYNFCNKLKDYDLISNIIINCFNPLIKSKIFAEAYYKDDLEDFDVEDIQVITLKNISITIGRTLASCYLNQYLLYNTTSLEQDFVFKADNIKNDPWFCSPLIFFLNNLSFFRVLLYKYIRETLDTQIVILIHTVVHVKMTRSRITYSFISSSYACYFHII